MANSTGLSLTFEVKYTPQPSILRGIGAFERSLKGTVHRDGDPLALPVTLRDSDGTHRIVIGPESFAFTAEPIGKIDRFGPGAAGLMSQYILRTPGITPREIELRALLRIPVPNLNRLLSGLASVTFTYPRKVELRPEAMGKDHFLPGETGIAHLRLSTHKLSSGDWIHLQMANRHDRISTGQDAVEQAYATCLKGLRQMIQGCTSTIYRQALMGIVQAPVARAGSGAA